MNPKNKNYIISAVLVIAVFIAAAVGVLLFKDDNSGASSSGSPDVISSDYFQEAETSGTVTTLEKSTSVTTTVRSTKVTTTTAEIVEVTTATESTSSDSYVEYHFRSSKLLNQHFEKHGGEFGDDFGYETAKDYEKGASDVINDPDALYKTEAEDGDGVYYIEDTNEFVILSTDGYIRTYFRPSGGIDYFNRQ